MVIISYIKYTAVCASDGYTYPSTCHMMAESQEERVPHVLHRGPCKAMEEDSMSMGVTNRTVSTQSLLKQKEGTYFTRNTN